MGDEIKEKIIQSICAMNCDKLKMLLDDQGSYLNSNKNIFIEKLDFFFSIINENIIKSENRNILLAYKGYCNNKDCENIGLDGYSFTSIEGGPRLELIFYENDIFQCENFSLDETIDVSTFKYRIKLYDHEKIGFKPTNTFNLKLKNCQDALNELDLFTSRVEHIDFIKKWIIKNQSVYISTFNDIKHPVFEYFQEVYANFNDLIAYSNKSSEAKSAIDNFKIIEPNDIHKQLHWLKIYYYLSMEYLPEIAIENNLFTLYSLKIDSEELAILIEFKNIYTKFYQSLEDMFEQKYPNFINFNDKECPF